MIVSEQLNYIKTRWFHAIFMPVIIEFSTNHEGLSQPIMKIGGAGSTTVLASCFDL